MNLEKILRDILKWTIPHLPVDKPRYLMGLGRPNELVTSVFSGVDMFDCVIPTREGRHGRMFLWKNNPEKIDLTKVQDFYETVNLKNAKFKENLGPVDKYCDCPLCKNFSRAYLRHLFDVGEPLARRLASIHNLTFYFKLTESLNNCLRKNNE